HRNLASSSSENPQDLEKWYNSFLPSDILLSGEPRLIHAYTTAISGFAARLTDEELSDVKKKPGFIHAYPDHLVPLHTTHTPDFLGLWKNTAGFWNSSNYGEGVIIGVLDSGISPDHPSFRDEGMPPPPAKWKGACDFSTFKCNNKLIGARYLVKGWDFMHKAYGYDGAEQEEPFDDYGHGTHAAGTAAGMFVANANALGQATGTAAGMAPYAHLAVYKVCTEIGCFISDMLAGLDNAINDGVDVLSLSLGGYSLPFFNDGIAIGAFRAVEKGIFVSCAAGNEGPFNGTVSNEAPWILTVGASTIDREIRVTVELGNGVELIGQSAYQPRDFLSTELPLVYPGLHGGSRAAVCKSGSLEDIDVRGKVVVCDADGEVGRVNQGRTVKSAGGAAMILRNKETSGFTTMSDTHVLPAAHVSYSDGLKIKSYISSASAPTASIAFHGTVIGKFPAPAVASLSARGPSRADPNILKPDIVGPGVNILAAWPFPVGSAGNGAATFNIISGTSMATPHLSGIAALLKSAHPEWSPAAVKSAIMTTADLTANDGEPIRDQIMNVADFYAVGSGHVNPSRAANPGLIYDVDTGDYVAYLCGLQYTDEQVSAVVSRTIKCSGIESISGAELNYPSFTVFLNAENDYKLTVRRTVTNVGEPRSTYRVRVKSPTGVLVSAEPKKLSFSKANGTAQYSVTFSKSGRIRKGAEKGLLTWASSDKITMVNSPIMVSIM
uniref:Subtilisin-like protease SBT1.2 n=1 Tax=Elaeis guineensis var. tenera TaxID=51953 RepID=A0A6J0PB25_ELAGV